MRPELQGVVEEASRVLGAPITLEDTRFDLVAYGSQRTDVDTVRAGSILQRGSGPDVRAWFEGFGIATATGPVVTPADPSRAIVPRLCVPARWHGTTYGYLWAYDWRGGTDGPAVARAGELAERAAAVLAQGARQRERAAGALADLLTGDPDDVRRAVRAVRDADLVPVGAPAAVVVAGAVVPADDQSVNLWRLPGAPLASSAGDGTTVVVPLRPGGDLAPAHDVARQVLALHAERGPDGEAVAGVGAACADLRGVRRSWQQARVARRVAAAVPGRRPVAGWDELGALRLVAADLEPDLVRDEPVRALLAHAELARTARTFLDRAGDVAATAAELAVHRQTLYHRLRRIEALTGLSFARGEDRLRLHLGLLLDPLLPPGA